MLKVRWQVHDEEHRGTLLHISHVPAVWGAVWNDREQRGEHVEIVPARWVAMVIHSDGEFVELDARILSAIPATPPKPADPPAAPPPKPALVPVRRCTVCGHLETEHKFRHQFVPEL